MPANVLWLCDCCGNWNWVRSAGQNEVMKIKTNFYNWNSNFAKPLLCGSWILRIEFHFTRNRKFKVEFRRVLTKIFHIKFDKEILKSFRSRISTNKNGNFFRRRISKRLFRKTDNQNRQRFSAKFEVKNLRFLTTRIDEEIRQRFDTKLFEKMKKMKFWKLDFLLTKIGNTTSHNVLWLCVSRGNLELSTLGWTKRKYEKSTFRQQRK